MTENSLENESSPLPKHMSPQREAAEKVAQ